MRHLQTLTRQGWSRSPPPHDAVGRKGKILTVISSIKQSRLVLFYYTLQYYSYVIIHAKNIMLFLP